MAPTYTFGDAYPQLSSQIPYVHNFDPNSEAMLPHMKADLPKVPVVHGPSPYGAHHSYPLPPHACCSHMAFPGYYPYSPSCPFFIQPQPIHWWGSQPVYPEAIPVNHVSPPPYIAHIPRYEYEKNLPKTHCCGCPNHICRPKDDYIRIEEQEPTSGKERQLSHGSQPLEPLTLGDYRYPIVWLQPDCVKTDEPKNPVELMMMGPHSASHDVKPDVKSSDGEPATENNPLCKGDLGLLMPKRDGRTSQEQLPQKKHLPFPIILMPYDKQEGAHESQKDALVKSSDGSTSNSEAESCQNHHPSNNNDRRESRLGDYVELHPPKESTMKIIPVKHADPIPDSVFSGDDETKGLDTLEKGLGGKGTGKNAMQRPVSTAKKSKLPPVCLRVDPLPKKKNGSSSSPSPPVARDKSCRAPADSVKENALPMVKDNKEQDLSVQSSDGKHPDQQNEKKVKVIEVMGGSADDRQDGYTSSTIAERHVKHPEKVTVIDEVDGTDKEDNTEGNAGCEVAELTEENNSAGANEGWKTITQEEKRTMSETDAATCIQAAYRGYEMRKWETLKKLKQLAKFRDEVNKIKRSVHQFKCSCDNSPDEEKVTRQKMVIDESIMGLLLKLDTIQGLHPSLREVRKSLARELVALQEEIDSFMCKRLDVLAKKQPLPDFEESMISVKNPCSHKDLTGREGFLREPAFAENDAAAESPTGELPFEVKIPSPESFEVKSCSETLKECDTEFHKISTSDVTECKDVEEDTASEGRAETKLAASEGDIVLGESGHTAETVSASKDSVGNMGDLLEVNEQECEPQGLSEANDNILETKGNDVTSNFSADVSNSTSAEESDVIPSLPELFEVSTDEHMGLPMLQKIELSDVVGATGTSSEAPRDLQSQKQEGPTERTEPDEEQHERQGVADILVDAREREYEGQQQMMDDNFGVTFLVSQPVEDVHTPLKNEGSRIVETHEYVNVSELPRLDSLGQQKNGLSKVDGIKVESPSVVAGAHLDAQEQNDHNPEMHEKEGDKKLLEENEKLRVMMQKLMDAGREQLEVISSLTGRVKDLETKLARNRKTTRMGRCRTKGARSLHTKSGASHKVDAH